MVISLPVNKFIILIDSKITYPKEKTKNKKIKNEYRLTEPNYV